MKPRRSRILSIAVAALAVPLAAAGVLPSTAGATGTTGAPHAARAAHATRSTHATGTTAIHAGAAGHETAPRTGPQWTLESTPAVGNGSELNATRCASATSCIAVGFEDSSGTTDALAETWNGTSWSEMTASIPLGSRASQLLGLSCLSASQCTAVGWYENTSAVDVTLAESWNGKSWSLQTTPTVSGATLSELTAVSCTATTSCLAVGYYEKSGTTATFAELWNGSSWTGETTPNPSGAKLTQLHGVACVSSTSCTAVGNYTNSANVEETLAESWTDKTWAIESTPALPGAQASAFGGISCASSTACTAVGDEATDGTEKTLAERWSGKSWAAQTTPGVSGSIAAVLTAVSCPTTTSCTSVGWYTDTAKVTLTLAEGWNGSTWSAQTTASSAGAPANYLAGVACAAASFCSSVGNQTTSTKAHLALAEQWVGARIDSTTKVTSSVDPAVTGQPVTITATVSPDSGGTGAVEGSVTFTVGSTGLSCGGKSDTVALSSGKAACVLSSGFTTSANHVVTAKYGGSGLVVSSTGTVTETVGRDGTSVVIESSANPAVTGETVTYTAGVEAASPGSGTPTGTVSFTIGGSGLACNDSQSDAVDLADGRAACTVTGPGASSTAYSLKAAYGGDGNYVSSDATLQETVHQGDTTTTVASSSEPSVAGQGVTFSATVATVSPASGSPTGSVVFSVSGSAGVVSCRAGDTATLVDGTATCVVPGLSPTDAPYTVQAAYGGDSDFAASSGHFTQDVGDGQTTVTITSNANPSSAGEAVTFTATVSAVAPAVGVPSGSVTFSVADAAGAQVQCAGGDTVTLSGGTAGCSVGGLAPADSPYTVTVDYGGDTSFDGSTQDLDQTVGTGDAAIALRSSANPAVSGESVTFTATVSAVAPATGTPTGTVTFAVKNAAGGTVNCSGGNTVTLAGGAGTCTITGLAAQSAYSVGASYSGDDDFSGTSATPLGETVDHDATTTALRSGTNPSTSDESVTFTATVASSAPGSGTPTGSVTFAVTGNGGSATCSGGDTVALSGGTATCTVTTMLASQSTYAVSASYGGDSNYSASTATPVTQTVGLGATRTVITSTADPSVSGQPYTLSATVSGAGVPTGSVTFTLNGDPIFCTGGKTDVEPLVSGVATCGIGGSDPGSYGIVATYGGDANFSASTSNGFTQTVDQDATTVTITSTADPNVYGEFFDLVATVTANAPGAGTPSGTVTFFINGEEECDDGTDTFTLSSGQADCPVEFYTTPGTTYSVTADYSGDSNYLASNNSAAPFTQTTSKDGTTTSVTTSNASVPAGENVIYTAIASGDSPGTASPPVGDEITFTATNQATGAVIDLDCGGTGSDAVQIEFVSGPNENEALCYAAIGTAGTYTVTATYDGDADFLTSAGTVTETVGQPG